MNNIFLEKKKEKVFIIVFFGFIILVLHSICILSSFSLLLLLLFLCVKKLLELYKISIRITIRRSGIQRSENKSNWNNHDGNHSLKAQRRRATLVIHVQASLIIKFVLKMLKTPKGNGKGK